MSQVDGKTFRALEEELRKVEAEAERLREALRKIAEGRVPGVGSIEDIDGGPACARYAGAVLLVQSRDGV